MRGRSKERGWKLNGERAMDMCPYCYSFCCDPMGMSRLFRAKINERLRKGLCPMCGQPKAHCKCKSSEKLVPGTHTIKTHNNKKRRKAIRLVEAKEQASRAFSKNEDVLVVVLTEDVFSDIYYSLHHHKVPDMDWAVFEKLMRKAGLDPLPYKAGWAID